MTMASVTAAQRGEAAHAECDAFLAARPSRQVLDRINDKWVALILVPLQPNQNLPFSDPCERDLLVLSS